MMKRQVWISILFGLGLGLSSWAKASDAKIQIISDIDDTAKITDTSSTWGTMWNSMFSSKSFVGMKELYNSFSVDKNYSFHYVTGAPLLYRGSVRRFLNTNGFPDGEVHTRPIFKDVYEYKLAELKGLLAKYPDDRFILVGDDAQKDVQVYDEVYRYAPDRILAVYIRKVANRPLPPSIYSFLTAYDIARTEYLMSRFDVWDASPVALTTLGEKKDGLIVPKFSYCPAKRNFRIDDPKVEEWNELITARVMKICRKRRLPEEILN